VAGLELTRANAVALRQVEPWQPVRVTAGEQDVAGALCEH
jgi:hypothetical protein